MICYTFRYIPSSFAIIMMGKRELVALLSLSSWCLVIVVWLFLAVPWVCLQFVIVVLPDHTHYICMRYFHREKVFLEFRISYCFMLTIVCCTYLQSKVEQASVTLKEVITCISYFLYYCIFTRWSDKCFLSHGMCLNQAMTTLQFLNDAESTQSSLITS